MRHVWLCAYHKYMVDFMTTSERSAHMAKIRSKDTKPEILLRQSLHEAGYRYRIHAKSLPGHPDIVFPARKKVIFVHGCFWHGHSCPVGDRLPKTNTEFWRSKRENNKNRDFLQRESLDKSGWSVLTVWECELNPAYIESKVMSFLGPPRAGQS